MNQDKEEYDVGIPLDDLASNEMPMESDSDQLEDDMPSKDAPTTENVGLPSLFDEDELAEVGLKASPFDENDELSEALDDTDNEEEAGDLPNDGDPPAVIDAEHEGFDTPIDVSEDDAIPPENLPPDELPGMEVAPSISDHSPIDLHHHFEAIQAQLVQLRDEFSGKIKYDEHKDEIIDKLHQELQEYKQDIVKKHILSIVLDVVKVADDIRKWITYFRSLDVSQRDPVKLFRYLEAIPSDLEDIFYWQGVKPYSNPEGTFDPAKQRAMKKIATDDPSKDKTIAKSLRPGYEWEGKVIRQEMVAVYVYQDDKESADTGNIDE
jgi:molecular chaperone GrpE (heat shock protein)